MRRGGWRAIGLAAVLIALAPLAHASPPDSSWMSGLWDDADFDDVVALVALTVASAEAVPTEGLLPEPVAAAAVPPAREPAVNSASSSPVATRGPPAA